VSVAGCSCGHSGSRELPLSVKLIKYILPGEVSERFKEHAWKACVGEILPWVQIPPSPPSIYFPVNSHEV
jgi:hypothetical protein